MIQSVLYTFIFLFEVLACAMFFENFYNRKVKTGFCIIAYALAFAFQYGMSFVTVPLINLITFIICNFLITLICYDSKIKTCVFTTLMLSFFMFITEIIVIYCATAIFKIHLTANENDVLTFVTQSSLSKLLFFIIILFIAKFYKNKEEKQTANKFTVLLGVLPLTSMANLYIIDYWGVKTSDTSNFNTALAICAILLLFANLFVFYVYEAVQKANLENTKLQLEIQRSNISTEYYELLSKEFENTRIIKHDIKNHLSYISGKADEGDVNAIKEYLGDIYKNFGLNSKIKYSGNKLIDVIINRYVEQCRQCGLELYIETCGSDLRFMSDMDTVALLDNLFENAIEAASKSEEKKITFSMQRKSDDYTVTDFVVISVSNSCDSKPKIKNGLLLSSKRNMQSHGIGTKSIKKVVDKYKGTFKWEYNREAKKFTSTVVLQMK